jgi:phosphoserine phosphatase
MAKIKLAIFDLEGTVFKKSYKLLSGSHHESAWGAISHHLGDEAKREDQLNRERYYQGGYPYYRWVLDTIKIYQKHGLQKDTFENIIRSVEYHKGAENTFHELHQQGVITAVISGGLKALADRVALDHRVEHCFTSAELYWSPSDNTLAHWNIMPTDFIHKKSILEMLIHEMQINLSDTAFIGDGINDVDIARHAGLSISFNTKYDKLRQVVTHQIAQEVGKEDLSAVLNYLL